MICEKIEDAQARLDEVNQEIAMVEKSAMTKQSIFEMLEGFSKYYDVMSPGIESTAAGDDFLH